VAREDIYWFNTAGCTDQRKNGY